MRVASPTSLPTQSRWWVVLLLMAVVIVVWRNAFIGYTPYDYHRWLSPWYRHILAAGPIEAFAEPFANYSPPYLYLLSALTLLDGVARPLIAIKWLSVAGAVWAVFALYKLLGAVGSPRPVEGAVGALLLPTFFFNVALLAQADAFWAAPAVLAVAAAIRRREAAMAAWAGLSFAIKAQAVFIAPFVVAVLLSRRAPIWYWVIPFLVYAAAMTPAWLAGWPAGDLATVYLRQVAWTPDDGARFVSNAANWWHVFDLVAPDRAVHSFWVGYVLAALATGLFVAVFARRQLESRGMILAACLSATMLPWLLPGMHERFFFVAELLAFALAWTVRDRFCFRLAVLMQSGLVLAVLGWLLESDLLAVCSVLPVTAALGMLCYASHSPDAPGKAFAN